MSKTHTKRTNRYTSDILIGDVLRQKYNKPKLGMADNKTTVATIATCLMETR